MKNVAERRKKRIKKLCIIQEMTKFTNLICYTFPCDIFRKIIESRRGGFEGDGLSGRLFSMEPGHEFFLADD